MKRFEESRELRDIFQRGQQEAKSRGHRWFEAEHILIVLLSDETSPATQALGEEVRLALLQELEMWSFDRREPIKRIGQGPGVQALFRSAKGQVVGRRDAELWPEHLLLGVLHSPEVPLHFNLRRVVDQRWGLEGFRQIRARLEESLRRRSAQPQPVG